MKALFGLWKDMKVADINRILKPHGVRLVLKKSKDWGQNVSVTAHAAPVRVRKAVAPQVPTGGGAHDLAGSGAVGGTS